MSGHGSVGDQGRPLTDHDHVRDLRRSFDGGPARAAHGSSGAQVLVQIGAQMTATLHEQHLIDRLVSHSHLRPVTELRSKVEANLLRTPLHAQFGLHY